MQNHNQSNMHVFLLYINVIISLSFKVVSAITNKVSAVSATILEITQDALHIVQTFYRNMFSIKHTLI